MEGTLSEVPGGSDDVSLGIAPNTTDEDWVVLLKAI